MRPLQPNYTAALRRRRLLRYAAIAMLLLLSLTVLLDHVGCLGYRGDDWAHFDGRSFTVTGVSDHGTLTVDARTVEVRLIGVDVPGIGTSSDHWAAEAKAYLVDRLLGK